MVRAGLTTDRVVRAGAELADEVGFVHEGRVLERGAPDDVLSRPQQPETQRFLRRLLAAR